jgi:hypothetical protein
MMAMTTSNSIRVNAPPGRGRQFCDEIELNVASHAWSQGRTGSAK